MISVTIYRSTLERLQACKEGLALYDAIAAQLPESDARRDKRIRIANWTPLHSIWPYAAGFGHLARWLEDQGIVPRANLRGAYLDGAYLDGAYLDGAYRGSSPKIPGWHTLASGYLERETETSNAAE